MRHVAYITDEGYYFPTKVSICSIIRNIRDVTLEIHVVAVALPDAKRQALKALETESVHIQIHNAPAVFQGGAAHHAYVSDAALLKSRIQDILPDLDKVLYLDGDTILYSDFIEIFDEDISDVYAAVVMDMCAMRHDNWYKEFGLQRYFNSGVMFLNLEKMRNEHVGDKFDGYFRRDDIPKTFCEQNALNAAFGEQVLFLGLRYNFLAPYKHLFDRDEVLDFFGADGDDYDSPAILHLAGRAKPWRTTTAPYSETWLEYVSPDDALAIVKNYAASLREEFSTGLAKQTKALSAVESRTDLLRGQFRIQAVLGENLLSETANGVLLSGFERAEKWGRWTNGNASVRVWGDDFLHTGGDLLLYARLRSFHAERMVRLVFNGETIREMTIPVESTKIRVKIGKSLLRSDNLLEIKTDESGISLAELGEGADTRKLCLGVEYIRFADNLDGALATLGDVERQNKAAIASLTESFAALNAALNAELNQLKTENALLADRLAFLSGNVFIRTFLKISCVKRRLFSIGHKKA